MFQVISSQTVPTWCGSAAMARLNECLTSSAFSISRVLRLMEVASSWTSPTRSSFSCGSTISERMELKQFTYKTDADNRHGTWAGPTQLVVQSDRKKTRQLFLHPVDGGDVKQLTDFPAREDLDVYSYPVSFCGDALTFVRLVPKGEGWVLYMGDSAGRGRLRLNFPMAGDGAPSLSPDCKWLAYVSDESGEREVWVRPFPGLGNGQQISKGGGNEPVWNRDLNIREIFYRDSQSMMAARISDRGSLEGKAEPLFPDSYLPGPNSAAYSRPNYDVFPDGSFLMLKPVEQEQPVTQINVVLNWSEELKRVLPTKK